MFWLVLLALLATQDHHATDARGSLVMGFDQDRTVHHFYLHADGGTIDIAVKEAADAVNRDAIRSHLPHIAARFGAGDFAAPMLVHDSRRVPGTDVLIARKATISYTYADTAAGGRISMVTNDAAALRALHQFLRYQIAEHRTGDPPTVTTRQ